MYDKLLSKCVFIYAPPSPEIFEGNSHHSTRVTKAKSGSRKNERKTKVGAYRAVAMRQGKSIYSLPAQLVT
jgi:hypothetical protein